MATIHRYPFFSHATSSATRALFQGRRGKLVNRGSGASFWFRPLNTSLSEVPVDDMEFGNIFRVTTSDRQEVSVQTALTVRIVDPELTARRVDFEIDQRTGEWTGQPLQNLQNRLAESAKQFAAEVVARESLRAVLDDGLRLVRDAIAEGLSGEGQLGGAGVEVLGVRVVAVRADEELERALQTRIREEAQADADRATYDRRAQAVDRERAIKENELNNRTELARREAELVELQGTNERRRTEQELERDRLRNEAEAANRRLRVEAGADEVARIAEAENAALQARLAVFSAGEPAAVLAAVAPEVLSALPKIDSLTLTPDLLAGGVSRLLEEVRG
jgi:band 7 protein